MSQSWSELRGALVDAVSIDWRNGHARVDVLSGPEIPLAAWVRASGIESVTITRGRGPVEGDRVADVRPAEGSIEIETRSGGVIRIVGSGFALEHSER